MTHNIDFTTITSTDYTLTDTPAHSSGTNYIFFHEKAGICVLSCSIWMNSVSANTWTNIGTIPSALTPKLTSGDNTVIGTFVMRNGAGNVVSYGAAEVSSTTVRVKSADAVSGLCCVSLNFTWVVN